jgi:enoyl-CoA hydratase/carnithine racemase
MAADPILLQERRGSALWLTLNRPAAQNGVTWESFPLLEAGIRAALADPAIRAIVLTGSGDRFFCVGGDLLADEARSRRGVAPDHLLHPLVRVFELVERCGLPIVARVNGHVMGPGMNLLAMCDLAVAADHALVSCPEIRVGLFPMLALGYLQRLVPKRKLLELALTGEPIEAAEAARIGLFNHVVPAAALDARLEALLGHLAAKSPDALRRGKHAFRAMEDMTLPQGFAHACDAVALLQLTPDFREGVRAFTERRPPQWSDKPVTD